MKVFWAVTIFVGTIALFADFENGGYRWPFGDEAQASSVSESTTYDVKWCKKACKALYQCGYYLNNEHNQRLSHTHCVSFCSLIPDDWAVCTVKHYKENGCCGKGFGGCATYLPDPP